MGEKDSAQIIGIPDVLCSKAGIAASWRTGNQLGVFPHKQINAHTNDRKSDYYPCEARIHLLRQEVILFHPTLRKLVNESNGVFVSIRNIKKTKANEARPELVKYSKHYRSILRACVESLQDTAAKTMSDTKDLLENFLTIFYNVECVWHLTEILYIDTIPGDVVLPQLMEWVRFHFPSRELTAAKILSKKTIGAELECQNYWETVFACALHGKLDIVRALLLYHSSADNRGFVAAENILRAIPVYNVYGGYSINEFTMRWKYWQLDLTSNIECKTFAVDDNLNKLMRLVVGDESVLWELSKYTDAWYELLAAKLFYSSPCCKQPELARHANNIAEKWQARRNLDNIILALMESDLHQVIKQIQYMNDNGWFAAHLTDLLYNSEKLNIIDKDQSNVTDKLHESLILDYGSTLMENSSLWQCGASYLENCPTQGLARLETLLQSIPLGNEAKVLKIINVAQSNGLVNVVTSISKIQGMKSIRQGRLGNALAWALKAQDGPFATYIADQFLKAYAANGELECRDLLENLGRYMLTSDRLTFLGKYCEFHQMYEIGEFQEAARLLMSLIISNLTPKYFWPILLSDAIPLLESEDVILSSEDTFTLMRCLEEHGDDLEFQDKVEITRLAAARNLSRALILEDCQND
ncbi:nuclear pore complex protein Nup85 [Fopius arisanus]|uniref:Nuclear pore complex protein Nup85 n=1 Tax=Fopius arisanus TaxID=64838 RepID=A0A0C9RRP8_9HYME|nr:PREDICTED: nuclear pore complex protein Nup85 [Fopius arisanus]